MKQKSNYAFKRTAELALGSNQVFAPQPLNAALGLMTRKFGIFGLLSLCLWGVGVACELPSDEAVYVSLMKEERELVLRALAEADLVIIGTVTDIRHGPETESPSERESRVTFRIKEVLKNSSQVSKLIKLTARLHHTIIACADNNGFWDDQVQIGGNYIVFALNGKILSASPPAAGWQKLGLAGQREVVLSSKGS